MDLEELRAAQSRERATEGLQELRDSFYEETAEYIAELRERRDEVAAEADDPFGSDEVQSLTDEIETAEQIAESLYERRVGKVVKQASLAAADMGGDVDGLTAEEKDLFYDLVDRIETNKRHVLDVIAGDAEPGDADESDAASPTDSSDETAAEGRTEPSTADSVEPTDPEPPEPPADEPGNSPEPAANATDAADTSTAAAAMGGGDVAADEADDEPAAVDDEPETSRTTLRITQDVGEIFGVDERAYELEEDDVVTLPKENADPLLERDAAERLGE